MPGGHTTAANILNEFGVKHLKVNPRLVTLVANWHCIEILQILLKPYEITIMVLGHLFTGGIRETAIFMKTNHLSELKEPKKKFRTHYI